MMCDILRRVCKILLHTLDGQRPNNVPLDIYYRPTTLICTLHIIMSPIQYNEFLMHQNIQECGAEIINWMIMQYHGHFKNLNQTV